MAHPRTLINKYMYALNNPLTFLSLFYVAKK